MPKDNKKALTVVYPAFDTLRDLWVARVGGGGLGNCFYTYFHAVTLAEQFNARVIAPSWASLKLGPLLRGEPSKRFYWRMFRPGKGDIHGLYKLWTLYRGWRNRRLIEITADSRPALVAGALNVVVTQRWTFRDLQPHREAIRRRLLEITKDPVPPGHAWGAGKFIAIHVRLGDFYKVEDPDLVVSAPHGTRLPIYWYINVARALQARYPDRPIKVFSDGKVEELQPLLDLGAELYRSGSDMTDLLAMSGASVLLGSNSTYSRWASFLGDMPTIWMKGLRMAKEVPGDRCNSPETPTVFVPIDATEVTLWP